MEGTGWDWVLNQFQLVLTETGLNRLVYSNWTDVDWLHAVRSGWMELRVQSEPVAVAVALNQGPKTRPNQTCKHYSLLWSLLKYTFLFKVFYYVWNFGDVWRPHFQS